jgi:hypothetical protein
MVEFFLELLKQFINNNQLQLVKRVKNTEFLTKVGWTEEDVHNFLLNELTKDDFIYDSVEKDFNFPEGTVYIFKKQICVEDEVYQIYIKIKYVEKEDYMVLLSFHESEEGEGNV